MATRSSVKVDFRAMVYGICEFQRLKIIHDDLKIKWQRPKKLYYNKSTINIDCNLVHHDRTKHVEIDK